MTFSGKTIAFLVVLFLIPELGKCADDLSKARGFETYSWNHAQIPTAAISSFLDWKVVSGVDVLEAALLYHRVESPNLVSLRRANGLLVQMPMESFTKETQETILLLRTDATKWVDEKLKLRPMDRILQCRIGSPPFDFRPIDVDHEYCYLVNTNKVLARCPRDYLFSDDLKLVDSHLLSQGIVRDRPNFEKAAATRDLLKVDTHNPTFSNPTSFDTPAFSGWHPKAGDPKLWPNQDTDNISSIDKRKEPALQQLLSHLDRMRESIEAKWIATPLGLKADQDAVAIDRDGNRIVVIGDEKAEVWHRDSGARYQLPWNILCDESDSPYCFVDNEPHLWCLTEQALVRYDYVNRNVIQSIPWLLGPAVSSTLSGNRERFVVLDSMRTLAVVTIQTGEVQSFETFIQDHDDPIRIQSDWNAKHLSVWISGHKRTFFDFESPAHYPKTRFKQTVDRNSPMQVIDQSNRLTLFEGTNEIEVDNQGNEHSVRYGRLDVPFYWIESISDGPDPLTQWVIAPQALLGFENKYHALVGQSQLGRPAIADLQAIDFPWTPFALASDKGQSYLMRIDDEWCLVERPTVIRSDGSFFRDLASRSLLGLAPEELDRIGSHLLTSAFSNWGEYPDAAWDAWIRALEEVVHPIAESSGNPISYWQAGLENYPNSRDLAAAYLHWRRAPIRDMKSSPEITATYRQLGDELHEIALARVRKNRLPGKLITSLVASELRELNRTKFLGRTELDEKISQLHQKSIESPNNIPIHVDCVIALIRNSDPTESRSEPNRYLSDLVQGMRPEEADMLYAAISIALIGELEPMDVAKLDIDSYRLANGVYLLSAGEKLRACTLDNRLNSKIAPFIVKEKASPAGKAAIHLLWPGFRLPNTPFYNPLVK